MTTPFHRYGLLSVTAMMIGGCAQLQSSVGPDYQVPELTSPARWTVALPSGGEQPARSLAKWWRQFGDPQLDQLIDEALAGSLDLRLSQARLRQALTGASRSKNAAAVNRR